MRIICEYSKKLETFLKKVVDYAIKKYGGGLDLSRLETIELKDSSEFEIETDGRSCNDGTYIIVTSRLYEKLPCYDIEKLEGNKDFKIIVNTLYHEMGHITDWVHYPNLYYYGSNHNEEPEKSLPAFFWLEYLAEKRSFLTGENDKTELYNYFVEQRWNPHEVNYNDKSTDNFFYLNKLLPYFLVGTMNTEKREYYISKICDDLLIDYINELWTELIKLEKELPFDEIEKLSDLYNIMDRYYKKFNAKYAMRRRFAL